MNGDLSQIIREFMGEEYSISPSQKSIDLIMRAGFEVLDSPIEQFRKMESIQKFLGRAEEPNRFVAKIFSLAFPYEHVLKGDEEMAQHWSYWLAINEYELAGMENARETKNRLYSKSLSHFLETKKRDDSGPQIFYNIGKCHFKLENYEAALPFFEESRRRGYDSKQIAAYIGRCLFDSGQFELGLEEFGKASGLAKQNDPSLKWLDQFDRMLEDSLDILTSAERIPNIGHTMRLQNLRRYLKQYTDRLVPAAVPPIN